jgi:hypothetical protein
MVGLSRAPARPCPLRCSRLCVPGARNARQSPAPALPTRSEAYPHLIFDGFGSALGARIAAVLKHLFPVPKDDSKRVVTFANRRARARARPRIWVFHPGKAPRRTRRPPCEVWGDAGNACPPLARTP